MTMTMTITMIITMTGRVGQVEVQCIYVMPLKMYADNVAKIH